MSFKELAAQRYSLRNYSSKPVEEEKIISVIDAARLAPSAVNFQPWKMIVVTDSEIMKKLHETYHRDWFKTAPVCIVVIGDHDLGWKRQIDGKDFTDIDVAIALDHLMLAAAEEGLGTCCICNFIPEKISDIFSLPANLEPIALIPIGYPLSGNIPEKKRKPIDQLMCWNRLE
jgi:nitroreductase